MNSLSRIKEYHPGLPQPDEIQTKQVSVVHALSLLYCTHFLLRSYLSNNSQQKYFFKVLPFLFHYKRIKSNFTLWCQVPGKPLEKTSINKVLNNSPFIMKLKYLQGIYSRDYGPVTVFPSTKQLHYNKIITKTCRRYTTSQASENSLLEDDSLRVWTWDDMFLFHQEGFSTSFFFIKFAFFSAWDTWGFSFFFF